MNGAAPVMRRWFSPRPPNPAPRFPHSAPLVSAGRPGAVLNPLV